MAATGISAPVLGGTVSDVIATPRVQLPPATLEEARNQPGRREQIELDIPVYITGMSFGALSIEAKMALAKGASMAGTATCSGEGGMIPPERDLSTKWYYQVIQSRYGFNPHHRVRSTSRGRR